MHFLKKENLNFQNLEGGSLRNWIVAIRPYTLFASVSPVLIGTSMAYANRVFHLPSSVMALFGAVFIQIGTNLANDYYDFIHGVDTEARVGPLRVTQKGIIRPELVKKGFVVAFFLSAVCGLYLIMRAGLPILIIGLISIACGIAYTAGPIPLGYIGIADLLVVVFFGPVAVSGTYYVQALSVKKEVILAGLAPGFISNAILVVNNLRDIETDARAGKRSLAVRYGKRFARAEYVFSLIVALFVPVFLLSDEHRAHLLCWLSFLMLFPCIRIIWQKPSPVYNQLLKRTSLFLFTYSVLFSAGWILR